MQNRTQMHSSDLLNKYEISEEEFISEGMSKREYFLKVEENKFFGGRLEAHALSNELNFWTAILC